MFGTETPSVLGFVNLLLNNVAQCKAFKDEITQAYDLMLKVIESHPAIVKKYVQSIVEVGRPVVISHNSSLSTVQLISIFRCV